jgi:hypothetical protein
VNIFHFESGAFGQSEIVFMTSDVEPDFQSKLFRFDMGVETFGVSTGSPLESAFHGVTVLNGNILVSDYLAEVIERFAPDGTHLGSFALTVSPTFLETDSSGNVYTTPASLSPPVATRFNSSGAVTREFTDPLVFHELAGIDADAAGNVYIVNQTEADGHHLAKFSPGGVLLNTTFLGAINGRDLAIDEVSNRLYMADGSSAGSGIKIFDISGAMPVLTGSISTPATARIDGVHFATESGNILATDFGNVSNDPRGMEFSPTGTLLREYRPTGAMFSFDITTFVIPEPGSLWLLIVGLVGLGSCGRVRCG